MTDRARAFARFGAVECTDDPLYVATCAHVAHTPALAAALDEAPAGQQRPTLWLAAVHDRLVARREDGLAEAPLAAWYRTLGGQRTPDAALAEALATFVAEEDAALRHTCRTRSTQTNEVGRCAVLWPMLREVARRHGDRPLALLDVGASAGLNLGVDAYRYDHGGTVVGAAPGTDVPVVPCQPVGPWRAPLDGAVRLAQRLGIDIAPVDLDDARAVRWLRACLWPSDPARTERFDQAVALARRHRWPVRREADCTAAIAPWLDTLPPHVTPVVFNCWVLAYFDADALARHDAAVQALVAGRGVAWLSAEGPEVRVGPAPQGPEVRVGPAPQGPQVPPPPGDTVWTLVSRGPGGPAAEVLGFSHPHGRHLAWRVPR